MEKLLNILNLSMVKSTRTKNDDDLVDRLNHRYTTFLFIVFAVIVTSRQYVGDPINCWTPAHFTSTYVQYTNQVCWVSNTYYLPFHTQTIPDATRTGSEPRQMISYYQWVPMILIFMTLFFHLPFDVWKALSSQAGIDVTNVVDAGFRLQALEYNQNKEKVIQYLTKQFDQYLVSTKEYRSDTCLVRCKHFIAKKIIFVCGRRYGNYLVGLYLFCKLLYVINCLCQMWMLNAFLRNDFAVYGVELLTKLYYEESWSGSYRFPRVTLCDFKVRMLARVHTHTVQCVLPINLFNEKIFIFVWFWLVFMSITTIANFLIWICRTLCPLAEKNFIKNHLKAAFSEDKHEVKKLGDKFVDEYLRHDGVSLIRLLELNANRLVTSEVIAAMWSHFKVNRPNHRFKRSVPVDV